MAWKSHSLPTDSTDFHFLVPLLFLKDFCSDSPHGAGMGNNLIQLNHGKTKQKNVADRHPVTVGNRCVRTG